MSLDKGDKAPDFALPGKTGVVKLSDKTGSVVYLDFWASWCGPCRQSFPWMNQMQAKYKAKGFQVVAVNLDAKTGDAMKFLAQVPAEFTVAFDPKGQTPRLYGVKGMPTSFLIDRNGKVLLQHVGFRPADKEALEQQILAALGGNEGHHHHHH
uniref:Putative Thiol:disulfide interchange protein DsbE n=1 Tax=Chlorobaculum tepidum (strain ATCC 49652 / DSM 12025 / NBRC 103806 / TLS) TaxID=194439 RepID=UPI000198F7C9